MYKIALSENNAQTTNDKTDNPKYSLQPNQRQTTDLRYGCRYKYHAIGYTREYVHTDSINDKRPQQVFRY
jgi:hypothetical protein